MPTNEDVMEVIEDGIVEELDSIEETGVAVIDNPQIQAVSYYDLEGKNIQEMFSLGTLEGFRKKFNCIECYNVEVDIFNDIADTSSDMLSLLAEGMAKIPSFNHLCEDIFLSLYKYKVNLIPKYMVYDSVAINYVLMQNCLLSDDYMKLRQTCAGDETYSLFGTIQIASNILIEINKKLAAMQDREEYIQQMRELHKKEQDVDELIDELDEILEQQESNNGGIPLSMPGMTEEDIQELLQNAQNAMDDLSDIPHPGGLSISMEAMPDLQQVDQDLEDLESICKAWGLEGGSKVPFDIKLDAIETIRHSEKLKRMTDMIGRFKDTAIAEQKRKTNLGATDIRSVTQGNKIQDALPSEKMLLNNATTKKDFYNRYSENKLAVYDKENRDAKNKGPIIVCCDESGSMSGDPEQWAKAITVGVIEIAQMQRRDFAYIRYSSSADEPIIISKGEVAPDKVIKICNEFIGGGTNFRAPLEKAMKVIETSDFKNADILFISDGDCGIDEGFQRKFIEVKEQKDFCCKGVLIDEYSGRDSIKTTLDKFCDDVVFLNDLRSASNSDSDINKAIFGSL